MEYVINKYKKKSRISKVISIFSLIITIVSLVVSIKNVVPNISPEEERSFFELVFSIFDKETLGFWIGILSFLATVGFGIYSIYTSNKSMKEIQKMRKIAELKARKVAEQKAQEEAERKEQEEEGKEEEKEEVSDGMVRIGTSFLASIVRFHGGQYLVSVKYCGESGLMVNVELRDNDICEITNADQLRNVYLLKGRGFDVQLRRIVHSEERKSCILIQCNSPEKILFDVVEAKILNGTNESKLENN